MKLSLGQFLAETEHQSQFLDVTSDSDKRKYVDAVWNIINRSFEAVGGAKGFRNKAFIMDRYPNWKVQLSNKKVVSVILYDNKDPHRMVAVGTDGSNTGKDMLGEILEKEFKRTYFELTHHLFRYIRSRFKTLHDTYAIPVSKVSDVINTPVVKDSEYMYTRKVNNRTIERGLIGKH